jgi:uncharacterized membrane protein
MVTLVIGLVLFLGVHSVRIVADRWRTSMIASVGERTWKGVYTLVSIAGLVLIVVGFGMARQSPHAMWGEPAAGLRHLNDFLTLVAFVLLAAARVPRNQIKAKVHHPMVAGVAFWALGHLLANNMIRDVVLFGAFLAWALVDYWSSWKRDAMAGTVYPPGNVAGTAIAVVAGIVVWAVFAFLLHGPLIGVRPFGTP